MKVLELYGGFHNSRPIRIRVTERKCSMIEEGASLEETLTVYQLKKLDNHFCGIKGCCCGGASRAYIRVL